MVTYKTWSYYVCFQFTIQDETSFIYKGQKVIVYVRIYVPQRVFDKG